MDYLFLEAIRATSTDAVARVITRELTKKSSGFVACARGAVGERDIRIAARGPWILVVERLDRSPVSWARKLSAALGGIAISARSWSEEATLEIHRFEDGSNLGSIDSVVGEALDVAFLADIAPRETRAQLRKELRGEPSSDAALRRIARLTGLPRPLDAHVEIKADRRLGFVRPVAIDALGDPRASMVDPPAAAPAARAITKARVAFDLVVHVEATRAEVVRAIRDELLEHGIRPCRRGSAAAVEREVLVRTSARWCSFGERRYYARTFGPGNVAWAAALSKRLARPVLMAVTTRLLHALSAWIDGREVAEISLPGSIRDEAVDASSLALFERKTGLESVALGKDAGIFDHGRAANRIAAVLGLADPLFRRAIDGVMLAFEYAR